jgi:hypothetical protein
MGAKSVSGRTWAKPIMKNERPHTMIKLNGLHAMIKWNGNGLHAMIKLNDKVTR